MSALFWIGAARILIVVTRYALALLAVHQTTRWAAFPSFVRLDDEEKDALLAPVREFFSRSSRALSELGFRHVTFATGAEGLMGVTIYLDLFVKEPEQDWAFTAFMVGESSEVTIIHTYVEFSTSFDLGPSVDTEQRAGAECLLVHPEVLPSTSERAGRGSLYRVHRSRVARRPGGGSPRRIHDEDTLTVLAEEVRRDLQEQVQRGWYYLHPGADPYRPTVKGAFLMTLGQMWPVKPLRELARWRRERGVLA